LGFKNGKAAFYIYSNTFIISPNNPSTNSWIFLAGLRNGSNRTHVLYENGNLVAQGSGVYSSSGGSHTLGIGRFVADCCQMDSPGWFNGLIDEVRLYNRALSDAEIKAIYDATK
jgi:hypothetical protein